MNIIPQEHLAEVSAQIDRLRASLELLLERNITIRIELSELVMPKQIIQDYILNTFSVSWDDIIGVSRKGDLVDARHCYCYLSRRYLKRSYTSLADELHRDHSSIVHGKIRIEGLLKSHDVRVVNVITAFETLYGQYYSQYNQ